MAAKLEALSYDSGTVTADTATWYKDAIIYQLHVRAFHDANGDGIGDFRGLTEKLDYIQELGVTAVWLLPFYPSPLKDDGYDIADYTNVNPMYGTLKDFKAFLREAHRRDLRVITELVLNHTSDQHPWFQRARRAKPGSKFRDFYVWTDDPTKYRETRIIFKDFEPSNWSWDPLAGQYYWHRFYSHQPDLNFDNPDVHQALFEVLDFWLGMGVDGLRLDAVPYLYEREGTTCENLPETHEFLKKVRRHMDEKYEDKMLLAEANQWPEDAVAYFGDGDECHMNFHFPLMPRLFMAVQREDRFPIIDILAQTPPLPENCQWAIFLRNHDELTLEMVTDEERDYMYRSYAFDPQARINLGIRRRLAPLLQNNRRKIELMTALLLTLPGTPIIYYGDEIGMGDNIYLGDRDGCRTPMQWSPDRNAGFSRANPHKLYLPPVMDGEYHFATRNVETESNSPTSLLWWMRRAIATRKRYRVFGRGSLEFLTPENAKVLVFLREYEGEQMLIAANLSRYPQYVELDLSSLRGTVPVEIFGQTRFPPIGDLPYFLTLGPHAFYIFRLEHADASLMNLTQSELPTVRIRGHWDTVFSGKSKSQLESLLPKFLKRNRWFGGKAKTIQNTDIIESMTIEAGHNGTGSPIRLVLLRVDFAEGEPDHYLLPVGFAAGDLVDRVIHDRPQTVLASLQSNDAASNGILYEAGSEAEFWLPLVDTIARRKSHRGLRGELEGIHSRAYKKLKEGADLAVPPHVHGGQQSNTSAIFGDKFIVKLFRRVHPGTNPDLEISRFLTEKVPLESVPSMAGAVEYHPDQGESMTLAIMQQYVPNEGDAWQYTLDELGRFVERVTTGPREEIDESQLDIKDSIYALAAQEPTELAREMISQYLQSAELLGRRTAELHVALGSIDDDPAFTPEPFTTFYQRGLYQSMRTEARRVFQLLKKQLKHLPENLQEIATRTLDQEQNILERFHEISARKISALRLRVHGDYHLGQVLFTGKDFVIIDFEGEPDRPMSERRIKRSPLRDVAGMIRSFHYASAAAMMGQLPGALIPSDQIELSRRWLEYWYAWTSATFLKEYLAVARTANFLPKTDEELTISLNAYILEKAVYELSYELNNRPDWVGIPLQGLLQISESES